MYLRHEEEKEEVEVLHLDSFVKNVTLDIGQ